MPRAQDLDFADRLGDAIVARRTWLAITQVDLAARLEVSPGQMSRYERGADAVSALMLGRIATALGTTPNDLMAYQAAPGALDHIEEASRILADPDISSVLRAMQGMDRIERKATSRIVNTFAEGLRA
jgi:transcriptional regulator with XRE-family HTH domain